MDEGKVASYLLNAAHPGNGGKARFFRELGYESSDSGALLDALLRHAVTGAVTKQTESVYGVKFEVRGPLEPNQKVVPPRELCSVWIVEPDSDVPRLVTAYPFRSRRGSDA